MIARHETSTAIDARTCDAFFARVRTETDRAMCWQWVGYIERAGYGSLKVRNGETKHWAHRLSFQIHRGAIPEGHDIDHLCRNRWCVNPTHLEPVTRRENLLRGDGPSARNIIVAACPRGHLYAGDNLYLDKRGGRRCRACARQRYLRAKETK